LIKDIKRNISKSEKCYEYKMVGKKICKKIKGLKIKCKKIKTRVSRHLNLKTRIKGARM